MVGTVWLVSGTTDPGICPSHQVTGICPNALAKHGDFAGSFAAWAALMKARCPAPAGGSVPSTWVPATRHLPLLRPRASPRLLTVGGMRVVSVFFAFSYVFPIFYNATNWLIFKIRKEKKQDEGFFPHGDGN